MTSFGSSIRIFLTDGTVTGIKMAELVNKTIQSISCPRRRVSELSQLQESQKPGVYFLFGQDEETGDNKVYIGETENVYARLQNHVSNKEFWNEVIFFVSKDENLTKAHIRFLESRLVQIARSTKRYIVENGNEPQASPLPRADQAAMEEFLTYIKLLLGVLGHKLLEKVAKPIKLGTTTETSTEDSEQPLKFYLNMVGVEAQALQTDEGIVVLKGSEAVKDTKPSMGLGYKNLKEKLIKGGALQLLEDKYIFQRDVIFSAPSAAGAVVVGRNMSGPQGWKDANGKSLKEIEEEQMKK